ncbi:MAG: hypothetical protein WCW31_05480 [Patescibacteria group bacterium]
MAEDPYRKPPASLANLYAGKRVYIETIGDTAKTLIITGEFVEVIQDAGKNWILLKDAHYFTHSGRRWETGDSEYDSAVTTDKITSDYTCIDASKVICINRNFDPTQQKK